MGLTADQAAEPGFQVVVNSEGQYSVWPLGRACPAGWFPEGTEGPRARCLAHIDEVWTDLRPRSLREHMARVAES